MATRSAIRPPRGTPSRRPQTEPDAALVERCARGDESAWLTLVERYRRLVYTIPYRMGLDPADSDDVFQVTFTRLAESVRALQRPERVRAWLVTTARRTALAVATQRRALDPEGLAAVADPRELPSDELARLEDQQLVRIALASLGDPCRRLLARLYYPAPGTGTVASYEAVAAELGMPIGSVGPTRMRCLRKLLTGFRRLVRGRDGDAA